MTPMELSIYDVVQPILGLELVLMDQNSPRPKLPYAAFKVKAGSAVGLDHYSDPNDTGRQTVRGDRQTTVSLQVYGTDYEKLELVRDSLRLVSIMDAFLVRGLTAYDTSSIMDISTPRESQIERRYNLDIFLRYRSGLVDDVGIIETADITGTVDTLQVHVVARV